MKSAASKTPNPTSAKPKVKSSAKHAEKPPEAVEAAAPSTPPLGAENASAVLASAPVEAPASEAGVVPTEPQAAVTSEVSREALIRHNAYLRYLRRSPGEGNEVDDWLGAEAEHARLLSPNN